ncbi:helix-turn-helix domain-containing protein [Candidatus Thiothrix anitrata]|uniref:Helix-turn-helix transcriptional regulator n=1 Tax=Candidatus Thiothrix anitrata TaxID=2823902 RepID=A0ABX7X8P4_9GAMM|nr:helix-turn-helix transcriptional regulator [Candidatus Thiothrix anitrata]QTR51607.1 helix-turn-helix transcriptional regulator [Candidatus Thiothrix anitrata]
MIVELDPIAIGLRLREVRGGMSQTEFAEQLGVAQMTVSNYETGKRIPDVGFLLEVLNKFDADPTWVISGLQPPQRSDKANEKLRILKDLREAFDLTIANLEKGKG